jgi:outer membrane protein TolC
VSGAARTRVVTRTQVADESGAERRTPGRYRATRSPHRSDRSWSAALRAALVLAAATITTATTAFAEEPVTPQTPETAPTTAVETISLETAIQRALASNFTIKVQSYLVPIADAQLDAARGLFDPRAFVNYNDNTQNNPSGADAQGRPLPSSVLQGTAWSAGISGELPLGLSYEIGGRTVHSIADLPGTTNDSDLHRSDVGGTLRLPLLRGFGRAASMTTIRIARTDRKDSEWEFRATVINTVTNVIYAYNDVLFSYANLRSARRARELAANLHAENERRNSVGSMSDYEVLAARARVATREESILIAERFVREAENAFKQLISDETSASILRDSLTLAPPPAAAEVIVDIESSLPFALEHRPDFRQAQLALERNEYSYRFYRNQLLPALNLEGSYSYNGSGRGFWQAGDEISDRRYPAYSTGVTLSFPLTSTSERARYRSARLRREQSEMALRQLEQDIVINVGNAAGQIETAWKRVLATRASRDLSQQALDAEEKKIRAGTGRTFDVLLQQEFLARDEVNEARALSDYRKALAEYDRQLGRTLETFHIDLADTDEPRGSR